MSNYKVTDTQLSSIANAIRAKGGTSDPLVFPSGFVSAIGSISAGAVLISKTISANGEYSAQADSADGFSNVVVDVPMPSGSINISVNGSYDVSSFANAVVSVAGSVNLGSKSISANGTYLASSDNLDGFSEVVVNVQGGGSSDNFLIAIGASTGSIYDTDASVIGNRAFCYKSLANGYDFTIEMINVETIEDHAFDACTGLTVGSFPKCTKVKTTAFAGCSRLTSITLPMCEGISGYAFQACSELRSIALPECLKIESVAFAGCNKLSQVSLPKASYVQSSCFQSCKSLTDVYAPSLNTLYDYDFAGCTSLVSVDFPLVGNIWANAFSGCTKLSDVSLPNCTRVASAVFSNCTALSQLVLPKCEAIYQNAFRSCTHLKTLVLLSESVAQLSNVNAFQSTPMSLSSYIGEFGSIYVPASLVDSYKSATNWSAYADRITAYTE